MPRLPLGRHNNSIVTASALQKAGTGTVQIVLGWVNDVDGMPHTVNSYHSVTEAAWPYTEATLKGLGWDPAAHDMDLGPLNSPDSPLIGKTANLVIKPKPKQNGEEGIEVQVWTTGLKRMADGEAQATALDLQMQLRAWSGLGPKPNGSRGPSRPPALPNEAPNAGVDDDVPF